MRTPVSSITGTSLCCRSSFCRNSNPLPSGRFTSSIMRAGVDPAISFRASASLPHILISRCCDASARPEPGSQRRIIFYYNDFVSHIHLPIILPTSSYYSITGLAFPPSDPACHPGILLTAPPKRTGSASPAQPPDPHRARTP